MPRMHTIVQYGLIVRVDPAFCELEAPLFLGPVFPLPRQLAGFGFSLPPRALNLRAAAVVDDEGKSSSLPLPSLDGSSGGVD